MFVWIKKNRIFYIVNRLFYLIINLMEEKWETLAYKILKVSGKNIETKTNKKIF